MERGSGKKIRSYADPIVEAVTIIGLLPRDDGVIVLNIEVINSHHLPSNKDTLNVLAHQMAVEVKSGLTDAKEYELINVVFVNKKTNGTASVRSSKTFEFKGETL